LGVKVKRFFRKIWLKAKTLKVLRDDYDYSPAVPGLQNGVFNGVIRHISDIDGSERDAAALFMMAQIGTMGDPYSLDEEGKEFVRRVGCKVRSDWNRLIVHDELSDTLSHIEKL
jgi:hypothetical protein